MAIKYANMTLSFILELAALVALGYWGFSAGNILLTQVLLGVGAPLLMGVVWGILLAPRAARRLENPWRVMLKVVIFGVACIALASAGQLLLATIFAVLVVISLTLEVALKQ